MFFEKEIKIIETCYKKRLELVLEENKKIKLEILKEINFINFTYIYYC